jgi:MinD-like ATPase involved in chromosome partitioning or flagellar assembly
VVLVTAQHGSVQPQRPASYTFIPLFPERWNVPSYERLRSRLNPRAPVRVACARPPLQGLAFLSATGQMSSVLDGWWRASVPSDSVPILIMLDEPELETWLPGLDAVFVIGVGDEAHLARYASHRNVSAVPVRDGPAELTEYVMRLYGSPDLACFLSDDRPAAACRPPATAAALRAGPLAPVEAASPGPAAAPAGAPPSDARQPGRSRPAVADESTWNPASGSPAPDPFHALVAARPVVQAHAGPAPAAGGWAEDRRGRAARQRQAWSPTPIAEPPPRAGMAVKRRPALRHGPGIRSMVARATAGLFGGGRRSSVPAELTQLAMAHTEGRIVGVISRAGGVGKTAVAAALGIIYGEAIQDSGWCAAVLDQNTGNPDQWGRMDFGPGVRTVSQIMADIEAGREWTIPAWNGTPALAVYPESQNAIGGYTPAQIQRFANRLRQLHMISVVDLPNRMPDPDTSAGTVSAGWVMVADLLAIPTTDDPTRLHGVVELLDAPLIKGDARNGYRSIPVIVAYVSSPLRAIRQNREVNAYLDRIRERAADVIEIPKDERATLAVIKGQPITEVNPRLREAYVRLALAVARTLADR